MMYIHDEHNFGFIAHPKTASSATQRVLRAMGAKLYGHHHEYREAWCRPILDSGGIIMSTIRNPFDLFVSWYFHYAARRPDQPMEPFKEWLAKQIAHPNNYMEDGLFWGLPFTNRVLRFEHLQFDFDNVMAEMGIQSRTIETFNVSLKREGRAYQEMYDSESILLVQEAHADLLAEYGYSFEEIPEP